MLIIVVALVVISLSVGLVFTFAGSDTGQKYLTFLTPITVALVGILTAAQNARNHSQNQQVLSDIKAEHEDNK